jgi:hypothetical protein
VLDAGDVLSLLRQCSVDLVLSGHRHVPYVWPIAGMLLVHSGTVSTLRTRGFPHPAYNLIRIATGASPSTCAFPAASGEASASTHATGPPSCRPAKPTRSCAHRAVPPLPTTSRCS